MKIHLRIRSDVNAYPGGDYVHLLKTRDALVQLGFDCTVAPGLDPLPEEAGAVHLFNTTRIHETYLQFAEARRRRLPTILTPIWHSMEEMRRFYGRHYHWPRFPVWQYMAGKELYYARRSRQRLYWPATSRYRRLQQEVVAEADLVIVSSKAELEVMEAELEVKVKASRIVPPPFLAETAGGPTRPAAQRRDLICAGRIEPRKNQLAVIRAFKTLPRGEDRLLLYGTMGGAHASYAAAVQAELAPGWVEYRGQVAVLELAAAYGEARASVLASYFETCGFAAMEALAQGAQACVSDTPYLRDVYGARVRYCDPFSEKAIAEAIEETLHGPPLEQGTFLEQYAWPNVLAQTREAYACALR